MKLPSRDQRGLVSFLSFVNVSCRVLESAAVGRDEVDVGLAARLRPVGRAQGVEHRRPSGLMSWPLTCRMFCASRKVIGRCVCAPSGTAAVTATSSDVANHGDPPVGRAL